MSLAVRRKEQPADFAELCDTMTRTLLAKHYGVSYGTLLRWFDEHSSRLKRTGFYRGHHKRPVPDDFAQLAPTMTHTKLRQHYGVDGTALRRWLAEAGVSPAVYVARRRPDTAERNRERRKGKAPARYHRGPQVVAMDSRRWSPVDLAADVLRRERWVVYRCDEKGVAKPEGLFWRVGNVVCDGDELLARAARYQDKAA